MNRSDELRFDAIEAAQRYRNRAGVRPSSGAAGWNSNRVELIPRARRKGGVAAAWNGRICLAYSCVRPALARYERPYCVGFGERAQAPEEFSKLPFRAGLAILRAC